MFPRDFGTDPALRPERAPQVRYSSPICRPSCRGWCAIISPPSPERALRGAMAVMPLIRRSLVEHEALMAEANVLELLRRCGWIKLYRSDATLARRCGISSARSNMGFRATSSTAGDYRSASLISAANSPVRSISRARLRARSGRAGQSLCRAVPPQGRTLHGRRCADPGTGTRRAMAGRDAGRHGQRARGRRGDRTVVRSGIRPPRLFDPAQRQARLPSAPGAARQCRAASSRARRRSMAICWRR